MPVVPQIWISFQQASEWSLPGLWRQHCIHRWEDTTARDEQRSNWSGDLLLQIPLHPPWFSVYDSDCWRPVSPEIQLHQGSWTYGKLIFGWWNSIKNTIFGHVKPCKAMWNHSCLALRFSLWAIHWLASSMGPALVIGLVVPKVNGSRRLQQWSRRSPNWTWEEVVIPLIVVNSG